MQQHLSRASLAPCISMLGTVRWGLLLWGMALVLGLQGCGFALRSSQNFVFDTVAVTPERSAGVAAELNRYLGARVRPLVPPTGGLPPDAVVEILQEAREKIVVGVNASGQVREFQLRLRVKFRLRTLAGADEV